MQFGDGDDHGRSGEFSRELTANEISQQSWRSDTHCAPDFEFLSFTSVSTCYPFPSVYLLSCAGKKKTSMMTIKLTKLNPDTTLTATTKA
jgi:hypothetical protein